MNKSLWNLYKNSERGKEIIALFSFDAENANLEAKGKEIFAKYGEFLGGADTEEDFLFYCFLIINSILADKFFIDDNEDINQYFERLIDNLELCLVKEDEHGELIRLENEKPILPKKSYKTYCALIPELSLVLYLFGDKLFYPILFREQFDKFIKILDVLEIPMPDLPAKTDKRGRLLLYNQLNKSISDFEVENNLTPEETCACIYDFAFILLDEKNDQLDMPEPTNIWLTGGSKEDYKNFLENPVYGANSVWTCNENTKRGDIIIIYVLSPYSCIQSIWRAEIDGVYTPFNYYNSRTRTCNGIVIPNITLNELKADAYFSKLPITRKNFQGVNGVQFSASDYKELQRLLNDKGFNTSILPQLHKPNLDFEFALEIEKDVEEKLLIPLLMKLGFTDKDWSRQLSQKVGRNEKAIPDFVFLPKGELHYQNAPLVIEVKFDMSSNLEKTKSYNQAFSYARMMKSSIFGICDKDRVIIYQGNKGYFDRFKPTFEKHWQDINDEEVFRQLKLLIGKDVIKNI